MEQGKFLSALVKTAAFIFILAAILPAQPLSKRNINVRITKQTLIPFKYNNYKRIGPLSKDSFILIKQSKISVKVSGLKNKYSKNIFLKLKGNSADIPVINEYTLKPPQTKNIFLRLKRY